MKTPVRSIVHSLVHNKFILSASLLVLLAVVGTTGYWIIGKGRYSVVDCLYMTVITLTTIGYGEIIDMNGRPGARIFTMFIALSGIGTLSYIITNFTASIVEGDLSRSFRRKRMEKIAAKMRDHYIVCGCGRVGRQIIAELAATGREFVIVERDRAAIDALPAALREAVAIEGDATDNGVLLKAGIESAQGLFSVGNDDNINIVICLTARQLNPSLRIVARCDDMGKREKLMSIGANAVVSPNFIGGLRMASEMVRPTVVSFLDIMLRDKDKNLRVEEVAVPGAWAGRTVQSLNVDRYPAILLLALRRSEEWVYNPPKKQVLSAGDRLIIMTNAAERAAFEQALAAER